MAAEGDRLCVTTTHSERTSKKEGRKIGSTTERCCVFVCETGPLLISTDLNVISNASLRILTAKELIAINQVGPSFCL